MNKSIPIPRIKKVECSYYVSNEGEDFLQSFNELRNKIKTTPKIQKIDFYLIRFFVFNGKRKKNNIV